MNKMLTAAAVSAVTAWAVGYSAMASAEATVYGRVVAGAVYTDADTNDSDDVNGAWNLGATDQDGSGAFGSRIGFKGETDLGNGLTAGFQIERGVNKDDTSQRFNNVYLSGGFGKITIGQQGNSYNSARNWDQTNYTGGAHEIISSRAEGIQYSMSSGPFSFDIMAIANDENEDDERGGAGTAITTCMTDRVDSNGDPETANCGTGWAVTSHGGVEESAGGDGVDGWIIRAGYNFGVVNLNIAHSTGDSDVSVTEATGTAPTGTPSENQQADYQTTLDAAHAEGMAIADGADRSGTAIGINGSAGPVDWYLAYQTSELNASGYANDTDSIGGFLGFRVSENDTIYAYHVSHSADRASAEDGLGEDYSESVFGYSRNIGPGVNFAAEYNTKDNGLGSGAEGDSPSKTVLALKYTF